MSLEVKSFLFENQFFKRHCLKWDGCPRREFNAISLWCSIWQTHLREIRSKHFFSSGLVFTWQVNRLSFAGGRLACLKKKKKERNRAGWEGIENHNASFPIKTGQDQGCHWFAKIAFRRQIYVGRHDRGTSQQVPEFQLPRGQLSLPARDTEWPTRPSRHGDKQCSFDTDGGGLLGIKMLHG